MTDCLFCKIRDGKIPAGIVYEDEELLAFEDVNPQAPTHLLIIPREHIASVMALEPAHAETIGKLFLAAKKLAADRGHAPGGYRLVMNTGAEAGQTVFHIHLHLLAGRPLLWPPG